MIYYVRTVTMQEGKRAEAIKWAKKAVSYINENFPDVHLEAVENVSGLEAQLHFIYSYKTFAIREQFHEKLWEDAGWQDLFAENLKRGFIIRNSIVTLLSGKRKEMRNVTKSG